MVERDDPARFDDLLTREDVERQLESGGLRSPAFRLVRSDTQLRASEFLVDVPWRPVPFTGMADVARAADEFARGATLVVQGMHHWWPALSEFCRALDLELGHPTQANAYYTPRSAQGLPVHHDTHDVFCLQLHGEKRWLVYEPLWELPLRDQRYRPELGEPGEPVVDVTLRPGDTLYLPRGWLHAAMTSDTESLHLTIGVNVYTWLDAVKAAVDELADDVEFRRSAEDGDPRDLVERLVSRLSDADVQRRRRRKLVATRRPILRGQLEQLRALETLDVDTELERRPTAAVDLDGTTLHFDGKTVRFPAGVRADLEFLAAADEPFTAADLPGSLDHPGRLVLVRRLVREGLLRLTSV